MSFQSTLFGLAVTVAGAWSAGAQAETVKYRCVGDRDENVAATLTFDTEGPGDTLKTLTMTNVPLRDVPKLVRFKGQDADDGVGENSEEKSRFYRWTRTYGDQDLTFHLTYTSHRHNKRLTLDESLVGTNEAIDGTPYGKLRIDVEFDFLDDAGISLFYQCTKI